MCMRVCVGVCVRVLCTRVCMCACVCAFDNAYKNSFCLFLSQFLFNLHMLTYHVKIGKSADQNTQKSTIQFL